MEAPAQEWTIYLRAIIALVFTVSLIYITAALFRKYGFDKRIAGVKGREGTLSVVETLYLDPRRRLVRVKAGDKEHLLLLGPAGDIVVSSENETHP